MNKPLSKRSFIHLGVAALGILLIGSINHKLNSDQQAKCKSNLYTLASLPSGAGTSYKCISSAQAYGPGTPIKD